MDLLLGCLLQLLCPSTHMFRVLPQTAHDSCGDHSDNRAADCSLDQQTASDRVLRGRPVARSRRLLHGHDTRGRTGAE
jgi:hypothetical protein